MATDLDERTTDDPSADDLNPGQQHIDDMVNALGSAEHSARDDASGGLGGSAAKRAKAAVGAGSLAAGEAAAGSGASAAAAATPGGFAAKMGSALFGSRKRKAATASGGTIGLLVAGLSIGSIFFSGPLELVHMAQFMSHAHLESQQDEGDERLNKLYRYVRSGGDAGETRLGYMGSKYKTKMIGDMEKLGLKPIYSSKTTIFQGFEIDTKNPESPYHDMTEDEVRDSLKQKGVKANVVAEDGKFTVSTNGFFQEKAANKFLVKELGFKGISSWLRIRVLKNYGMVTWHPLRRVDRKANEKLSAAYDKYKESKEQRYKSGITETTTSGTASTEETDKDGKVVDKPIDANENAAGSTAASDPTKSSSTLKNIASGNTGKIVGGIAAVQGVVCGAKAVADNVNTINYTQIALPLMRMGWDSVTVGNQIMSGDDIDADSMAIAAQDLNTVDSKTGKMTSWDQAESIQAQEGHPNTGVAAPDTYKNIGKGIPSWLDWTQSGPVGAFCSKVATAAGFGISIILGAATGPVSTLVGTLASYIAAPKLIGAMSDMIAGKGVSTSATGAELGSAMDYGMALNGNEQAIQFGGAPLTDKEVAELSGENNASSKQDFASKSIAYRLFDAKDYRSVAGKAVTGSAALQPKNIASTISSSLTNLASIFRLPAGLAFSAAHADSTTTYDYGFKTFGFSRQDMDNPAVADPYANADAAAAVLDNHPDYVQQAADCFGIKLEKADEDGAGVDRWQAVTDTSAGEGHGVNLYNTDKYDNAKCRGEGNSDWLRVRFFIFDSGVMDGWACYNGDDVSCQHDGVTDSNDTSTSTATGASFRIASYNVRGASHTGGQYKGRMDKVVQNLNGQGGVPDGQGIDIVGFQEMQGGQHSYFIQRAGSKYAIFPSGGDNKHHLGENSIAWDKSKFQLVGQGQVQPDLVYFGGSTLRAPYVKLRTISTDGQSAGQEFYVLNTHDPANTGSEGVNNKERYENAKQHVKFINQLKQENIPIFYTGDFNSAYVTRDSSSRNGYPYNGDVNNLTYCVMVGSGAIKDGYDVYRNRQFHCPNPIEKKDKKMMWAGIDHVYMTDGVTVSKLFTIDQAVAGSDHKALVMDVTIPGAADGSTGGTNNGVSKDGWQWPVAKKNFSRLSQCLRKPSSGDGHTGIDIPVPIGTPVYAAKDGTVVKTDPAGGTDGGRYIIIQHGPNSYSNYQHNTRILVHEGQVVKAGQQIAVSGNTGYTKGPHVHFSITTQQGLDSRTKVAYSLNPLDFLPKDRNEDCPS